MPILKPCPFCGERAKIEKGANSYEGPSFIQWYRIGCNKCEIWFYGYTEMSLKPEGEAVIDESGFKGIVERWNRRT